MTDRPMISEADMCSGFIAAATSPSKNIRRPGWTAYAETAGFDILLVRDDGVQIGIEAKLALNPRVVAQILPYRQDWHYGTSAGPDYRAVLVPAGKCNSDVAEICSALGITVLTYHGERSGFYSAFRPGLPCETDYDSGHWHEWAPAERCAVPDYIPDVVAGASAPVALTAWKVKAIKLAVLLEERPVTRADFRHLQLSPTNWLCPHGWLRKADAGWVAGPTMRDFKAQHPRNYDEIKADKDRWAPKAMAPAPGRPPLRQASLTLPQQANEEEARR